MDNNYGQNVLPGPNSTSQGSLNKEIGKLDFKKYSALGIFLAIILGIVVIVLGERIIFDLNRYLNPVVDKNYTNQQTTDYPIAKRDYSYETPSTPDRGLAFESSGLSSAKIYYPRIEKSRYTMYKLIIHSAFIIPILVLAFFMFYLKKDNVQLKPLLVSGVVAAFWLLFHLLGEVISFVKDAYQNAAIYVILLVLAGVIGALAYFVQKKHEPQSA